MTIHEKIIHLLEAEAVEYRLCEHIAEGRSEQIAKIRGNAPEQALKAIVVMAKESKKSFRYYLAVVPGNKKIDLHALEEWTGAAKVIFAPVDKAKELTACEIGAIPPFSFHSDLRLVVDPLVKGNETVVYNAGLLTKSIFMKVSDYLAVTKPSFASITQ